MVAQCKKEVFTAGCPVCQGVVQMVNEPACPHLPPSATFDTPVPAAP